MHPYGDDLASGLNGSMLLHISNSNLKPRRVAGALLCYILRRGPLVNNDPRSSAENLANHIEVIANVSWKREISASGSDFKR